MIGLDLRPLLNARAPQGPRATSTTAVAVRDVHTLTDFDELKEEWDKVVQRLDLPSPFLSWLWHRRWWEAFGGGHCLRILVMEACGETLGVAPLYERAHRIGPLTLKSLVPIGWEDGGNQPMTEHIQLLFPSRHRAALMDALAGWLRSRPWLITWLPSLDEEEQLPPWIGSRVVAKCPPVPFHHRSLPASWDELVSALNKSMRDNVKYYPRLMVRHGHEFTFDVAATPDELDAAFPILVDLHHRRAETAASVQHWNYLSPAARREFIAGVSRELGGQGEAKLGVLRVRGEPVAAYLWLERGETMFLYRSGYAPEWSKYSVALVAATEAIKDGIRRGIRRLELLRGGGQLKERWDTEVRVRRHVMLARNPRLARLLVAARAARTRTTYDVV